MSADGALALLRAGNLDGALALLEQPVGAAEYGVLGMALLAAERWQAAASALHTAAVLGDDSGPTLLNLALAEDRLGEDGRGRMQALAQRWPYWDDPPLRLAESFRRGQEIDSAITAYEQALSINPDRAEALLGFGAMLIGHAPGQAQELLLRCCGVQPDNAEAWDALGIALRCTDDDVGAELAFTEATRLRGDDIAFALRRADAARAAGNGERELLRLDAAVACNPGDATLVSARGVLLYWLGRLEEAIAVLRVATALAPTAPQPAAAFADCLVKTARLREAVPALRRALALAPESPMLRNNLAAALTRNHFYAEAREMLEALIADHGERPEFLGNLANALVLLGLQREGVAVSRRAIELVPDVHFAWKTLGASLIYSEDATGEELRTIAERTSATLDRDEPAVVSAHGPERRLRLGLLSAKLMTHPVGYLTVAAFEALDANAFEIVCFGPRDDGHDPMQRRFRAIASEWHAVLGRPVDEIPALIRERQIDVLIDLGGWGDQGWLKVCRDRPAPVQIKWVGNQAYTTGMPEIDWFITDRWETPPGFERFYTERLLRLPDGYACYSPPAYAPDVAPLPAALQGHVTFGGFHNFAKVTPAVIAAWARVLHRMPTARLVLKGLLFNDAPSAARVLAAFVGHGINPGRVTLHRFSEHRAHLGKHAEIDIMLDAFPYSGGLTTCEALYMGVPVVTLAGECFAARHSTSHLSNVGLGDWVAETVDDYVELAVAKANDLASLAALRGGLRGRVLASPLCDAPRFGRHLGEALRGVWREACARP
jgi:predicted O-linked N-acetylglucosamine transferase (SPINDLY family)